MEIKISKGWIKDIVKFYEIHFGECFFELLNEYDEFEKNKNKYDLYGKVTGNRTLANTSYPYFVSKYYGRLQNIFLTHTNLSKTLKNGMPANFLQNKKDEFIVDLDTEITNKVVKEKADLDIFYPEVIKKLQNNTINRKEKEKIRKLCYFLVEGGSDLSYCINKNFEEILSKMWTISLIEWTDGEKIIF